MTSGKLLESDSYDYGFDAQAAKYRDMVVAGVIDPTKPVCMACRMPLRLRPC